MNGFRQIEQINVIYVHSEKYAIATKENTEEIRTVLGTCGSLIGLEKEKGIGFITHNMFSKNTKKMIQSLRDDLLKEFGLKIEDFDLYISGGKIVNFLSRNKKETIGEENTNNILNNINKKPVPIHLNKNKGNTVKLNFLKNKVESTTL